MPIASFGGGTAVKSVQRGTSSISAAAGSTTAVVSTVNLNKSHLSNLSFFTNATTITDSNTLMYMSAANQITITRTGTALTVTISWELIEYY